MNDIVHKKQFNIALLGLQVREERVIQIVLKHVKSTQYTFNILEPASTDSIDIAIANRSDNIGRDQLHAALARQTSLQVIHLVQVAGQSGERYELLPGQLMSHLLPLLQLAAGRVLAGQASNPAPTSNRVVQLAPAAQRRQLRALVVDDSPTVRTQIANVVSRIGMLCDAVDSAQVALARLADASYDIIYIDVVMPDMDGYKLTREIKRDRANKTTPVIILTSQSSPFDRARGALAGCDTFLTKPVGLKQFYDATVKVLRKSMAIDDLGTWLVDPTQPLAAGAAAASNPVTSNPVQRPGSPTSNYNR
jgi:two-component system, cell cycle response regulator